MRQLILGHRGMVGAAIHRLLPQAMVEGVCEPPGGADLRSSRLVGNHWLPVMEMADVLYLCAARVGGIKRNMDEPGAMIYDNLMIQANVIEAARIAGVKLIVFLGSSCIYPRTQRFDSIDESQLLTGPLEPTNEAYAVAKIAGIKMLEAYHRQYGMEYLAVMPCNLYGPGDNYDLETAHFLPAMIRRLHEAKLANDISVTLWGTGQPRRELMHVDDCARIIVELVTKGARGLINIGPGVDYPISDYAARVKAACGYGGMIEWNHAKPDGVRRKLLDVSRMQSFGVGPSISLADGIARTYADYVQS